MVLLDMARIVLVLSIAFIVNVFGDGLMYNQTITDLASHSQTQTVLPSKSKDLTSIRSQSEAVLPSQFQSEAVLPTRSKAQVLSLSVSVEPYQTTTQGYFLSPTIQQITTSLPPTPTQIIASYSLSKVVRQNYTTSSEIKASHSVSSSPSHQINNTNTGVSKQIDESTTYLGMSSIAAKNVSTSMKYQVYSSIAAKKNVSTSMRHPTYTSIAVQKVSTSTRHPNSTSIAAHEVSTSMRHPTYTSIAVQKVSTSMRHPTYTSIAVQKVSTSTRHPNSTSITGQEVSTSMRHPNSTSITGQEVSASTNYHQMSTSVDAKKVFTSMRYPSSTSVAVQELSTSVKYQMSTSIVAREVSTYSTSALKVLPTDILPSPTGSSQTPVIAISSSSASVTYIKYTVTMTMKGDCTLLDKDEFKKDFFDNIRAQLTIVFRSEAVTIDENYECGSVKFNYTVSTYLGKTSFVGKLNQNKGFNFTMKNTSSAFTYETEEVIKVVGGETAPQSSAVVTQPPPTTTTTESPTENKKNLRILYATIFSVVGFVVVVIIVVIVIGCRKNGSVIRSRRSYELGRFDHTSSTKAATNMYGEEPIVKDASNSEEGKSEEDLSPKWDIPKLEIDDEKSALNSSKANGVENKAMEGDE